MRAAPTGWIVNRFVVPASRLADVGDEPLHLSVVYDTEARLADARIEAVEVPPAPTVEVDAFAGEIYLEQPVEGEARGADRLRRRARAAREGALRRCVGSERRATRRLHPRVPEAHRSLQGDGRPSPRHSNERSARLPQPARRRGVRRRRGGDPRGRRPRVVRARRRGAPLGRPDCGRWGTSRASAASSSCRSAAAACRSRSTSSSRSGSCPRERVRAQHLPYGVFRRRNAEPRVGVRYRDEVARPLAPR